MKTKKHAVILITLLLFTVFNSALDLPAQGFCRLPESADRNNEKSNV